MRSGSMSGWNTIIFKKLAPHSTFIMVHAAVDKTTETRALIHQAGHTVLFLPPDSLDFNPINQDFATIKTRRISRSTT